jgi:nickel transport protein
MKHVIWLAALALHCGGTVAHEVNTRVETAALTVVTLTYADGKPFAYEQFEITPEGSEVPSQVGRTDALGRAAILPVAGKALEIVATTKDGHGTRLTFSASAASAAPPAPTLSEPPRWMLFATGAGILFGLFGLLQLFTRRKEPTA